MNTGVHTKTASAEQYSFKLNRVIYHKFSHCLKINMSILINIHLFMWFSLFNVVKFSRKIAILIFVGIKDREKLKIVNINPHVFGANPRKFGDAKIYHFMVCNTVLRIRLQHIIKLGLGKRRFTEKNNLSSIKIGMASQEVFRISGFSLGFKCLPRALDATEC